MKAVEFSDLLDSSCEGKLGVMNDLQIPSLGVQVRVEMPAAETGKRAKKTC